MADHVDEHLEQVRAAREAGFVSVFAGQHYFSSPYQMLHPVPLLARVAARPGWMRLVQAPSARNSRLPADWLRLIPKASRSAPTERPRRLAPAAVAPKTPQVAVGWKPRP